MQFLWNIYASFKPALEEHLAKAMQDRMEIKAVR